MAAAVLTGLFAAPLAADAAEKTPQDELRTVEQNLSAERQREKILSRKRTRIESDLAALRKGLVAAGARIQKNEAQVTKLEKRLTSLNKLVAEKSDALEARHKDISAALGTMVRISRSPRAVLVSAPGNITDAARSVTVMRHVTDTLQGQSKDLQRDLIQLASLRGDVIRERKSLEDAQAMLAKERGALDILLNRKASLRQRTVSEQGKLNKRLARLSKAATSLRSLLDKLNAEAVREEKRKQTALRAARPETPAGPPARATAKRPERGQKPAAPETDVAALQPAPRAETLPRNGALFSDARGRLPLPARGKIVTLFGAPNDNGGRNKGITLATRSQATVVAPYDGKVVYAGQFRGYGELLIIAHGEGYHTLLAGMARIYGVVGQRLLAGEPVGLMADSPNGVPRLYVELRRDGVAINPVPWLAASERKVSG